MNSVVELTISVPKRAVERARELGLDLESIAIEVLLRELKLDPAEEIETRLELAKGFLDEAKSYIVRGDAVQSSEKLYKAAEGCIKVLAQLLNIPEVAKARELGRWFTWLLDKAARSISKTLGEHRVKSAWDAAYSLHVWGFHEAKLTVEDIEIDVPQIEWLIEYTEKLVKEQSGRGKQ